MKQAIEKNVVSISIGTALTVLVSVAIMVWNVSEIKAEFVVKTTTLNTKIVVLENKTETQQNYLYNLKSDLKEEIEKNNKKLDAIYNLLLKR